MTDPRPDDTGSTGTGSAGTGGDLGGPPDPDSAEFLESMNTVEQVSPGTTADAPATDPTLIPTDPGTTSGG